MINIFLTILISYLIGCFSSAYVIGRLFKGIDIRSEGSGNSGTTNALRVMGIKLAVLTFILDLVKGIISANIGKYLLGDIGVLLGGLFSVIGHNWPIFLDFKGGKGIATSLGVFTVINLPLSLISVIIGFIVALTTNYVSVGSLSFLTSYLVLGVINYFKESATISNEELLLIAILFILGFIRHKDNIKRLLEGKENKFRGD